MTITLVRFNAARNALAEARSIDEVKNIRDKAEALRLYSIQQRESLGMQNDIAEIKIRAERRIGEIIPQMQERGELAKQGGDRKSKCSENILILSDIGITPHQSSDWQAVAKIPEETFEEHIATTKAEGEELTSAATKRLAVHFTSDTPEWYTPIEIIDMTLALMGKIDLDPCSNSKTSPRVPAYNHFTLKDDGLSQEWTGRVYMNPPYGREITKWLERLVQQYKTGNVTEAIALVPSRTDTEWFRRLRNFPRCFIFGRLKFSDHGNAAPFPSMAVYLGNDTAGFIEIFGTIGDIFTIEK